MESTNDHTDALAGHFKDTFGYLPQWHIKTPGRVNLIGEHTDYNLLPVLPMPIQRAINFVVSPSGTSRVCIQNANPRHSPVEIDLSKPALPVPGGHWSNYCLAAIAATVDHLRRTGHTTPLQGFDAVASSDLPEAAGLSSSSALVISTCLALLKANGIAWPMEDVAEQMRHAENYVGTAGGGMDQAVIALGRPESALLVEFAPLTPTPVSLPAGLRIYIINSGQKAEKTGSARFAYNLRALECAIGVELLKRSTSAEVNGADWTSLRDVYTNCRDEGIPWTALTLQAISPDNYTLPALIKILGRDTLELLCNSKKLDLEQAGEWLPDGVFNVLPRVTHVLNETDRVYNFRDALEQNDLPGVFLNAAESHASLRDLYHVSTPQIERLVQGAAQCGAGAARITGAGFGGCIVAFVEEERAESFVQRMVDSYVNAGSILEARSGGSAGVQPVGQLQQSA